MRKSVTICLLIAGFLMAIPAYAGQDMKISVNGGTLHGTIELPSEEAPCPVALIISGSGPTDRDGNNPLMGGKNNSLKLLAEALASKGIASVRYDKRGIGESTLAMTKEEDLRFETYIEDVMMWGTELQRNKRFTHVAIIGHSEGSLIGLVACQKIKANAFVSISGAGIPSSNLLLSQLMLQLPKDLFDTAEAIINQLNQGKTVASIPTTLNALFRRSVQPYLISWFRYDPAKEIAKLNIPIMIIHGSTDIQMDRDNAKILAKSNRLAKLITINGMNHILKKVSGNLQEQLSSYGDPSIPIADEIVEEITSFMMSVETKRPNKNMP
jgi:hypothetical protein